VKGKISMVTLGVRDVARSLAFYRDGLGFQTHNYKAGDDMVMFALEGSWLGIYPREALAEDAGVAGVAGDGGGFAGFSFSHNVGSKAEVDAVIAFAIAAGGREVKAPRDVFWGGYAGYFADPDGFLWEACWNPFTDLT
jgi:catechol 2,3-dioxygenase-like lactoylglutathione lyase family enzyme